MERTIEHIWGLAKQNLRKLLSNEIYHLWFEPLQAVALEDHVFTLQAVDDFSELWLRDNYLGLICEVLTRAAGEPLSVDFQLRPNAPADRSRGSDLARGSSEKDTVAASANSASALRESPFNPKNTFETFVIGNNNNFAHAAAMAVAQAPGKSYNPLFFYGGVGLGKTHLLHAIGQHVMTHHKRARVAYVSSEKFTNEFIEAIQNNHFARFRKKYRQTDVFLIDDIQFLAGKERIQEEFFHTFNALHEAHKQIVVTCDRPASGIQNLEQRLVSRFEWGLVTDMQPPDVETRLAILKKKEKAMGVQLPEEILTFLATRIRTNIRRLEGALMRVTSYASLTGQQLSIEMVEHLLREVLHEEGRCILSIELIQKKVAEDFDIRVADMSSKRRPESIAFPRQIAMYLARQMTQNSLEAIGEAFGGRDHGTVAYACSVVGNRMETDEQTRHKVEHLEKRLRL